MEELFWPVVLMIALGAVLSWIGRTWAAQIIAWAVVGFVGGLTIYFGMEVYRLLIEANSVAEEINSPLLIFALELVDLKPIAAALKTLNQEQRNIVLFVLVLTILIAITLPFVTFANSIWSAIKSEEGAKSADSANSSTNTKLQAISSENDNLRQSVSELSEQLSRCQTTIETISEEIRLLRLDQSSHGSSDL